MVDEITDNFNLNAIWKMIYALSQDKKAEDIC